MASRWKTIVVYYLLTHQVYDMRQRSLEHSEIKVQSEPGNPHEALNLLILFGKKDERETCQKFTELNAKEQTF